MREFRNDPPIDFEQFVNDKLKPKFSPETTALSEWSIQQFATSLPKPPTPRVDLFDRVYQPHGPVPPSQILLPAPPSPRRFVPT